MDKLKSIMVSAIFMVSAGSMADYDYDNGDTWRGTEYPSGSEKTGTYTWTNGNKFIGTWFDGGDERDGDMYWAEGGITTWNDGVKTPWFAKDWGTSPGFDWDEVTQDDRYTKEAHEYAEQIIPGITDIVDIKVGNVNTEACSCGGWYQGRTINGVDKYRIVISEHAFMSGWVGGSYDWGYGYKPFAYYQVAHELSHYLDFMENRYDSGTHGLRHKHFVQELVPEHLLHFEEDYDYPGDKDTNFDRNIDY